MPLMPQAPSRSSGEALVLAEVAHRLCKRIAAEWIAELLGHEHLENRRTALTLRGGCSAQRGSDVGEPLDRHPIASEGAGDCRPARVLEIHALVTTRVEIDVILLLRAPLIVVEDDHGHAELLAGAGEQLVEADAKSAVADVGERRALGSRDLRAADDREGVAAVAEA